jgi:hypothetical protein
MGCAELTHSSLCDVVNTSIESGHKRRSVLELFHSVLNVIKNVPDMPGTNGVQNYYIFTNFVQSGQKNVKEILSSKHSKQQ